VAEPLGSNLREFLVESGLPDENLVTEQLEVSQHDLDHFTVIVSLCGKYQDYLPKVPFHSSALNWTVPQDAELKEKYRILREEIQQLMNLMAGDEAG
jgi:hypothetical protein